MSRRLNYRLLITMLLIVASATVEIARERRPFFLAAGPSSLCLCGQRGRRHRLRDRPDPRQQNCHHRRRPFSLRPAGAPEIQSGLGSLDGGRVCVRHRRVQRPDPGAHSSRACRPSRLIFRQDGNRAYVAASGSATLVAIDCRTGQIVGRARTGKRPWLARVTPDGKQIVVPNREDSTVEIFDAATLASLATIPVASHPEQVASCRTIPSHSFPRPARTKSPRWI